MSGYATDAEVKAAIAAHREWERSAMPSAKPSYRVMVEDGSASRRPFKRNGHWCVRLAGTARLLAPVDGPNGWQTFPLTYSWKQSNDQ